MPPFIVLFKMDLTVGPRPPKLARSSHGDDVSGIRDLPAADYADRSFILHCNSTCGGHQLHGVFEVHSTEFVEDNAGISIVLLGL